MAKSASGTTKKSKSTAPNVFPGAVVRDLDKVIHEKTRLGIMTTLASFPKGILFTDLKDLNDLTDGNLNRHLKVLADASLIITKKSARGRNSRTTYQLSKRGLAEFVDYLDQMEQVLQRAAAAARSSEGRLAKHSTRSTSQGRLSTE